MATAAQSSALKDIGRFVPVKDIIAGGLARAASQSTIHPLDTVKVRMQATLKGVAGAAAPTPPSVGKYGVGLSAVSNGAVSLGKRSLASAAKAGATKFTSEVGMMYKGCFGAATGAGIAIGAYFAFYGTAKKLLQEKSDMPVSQIAFVAGGIVPLDLPSSRYPPLCAFARYKPVCTRTSSPPAAESPRPPVPGVCSPVTFQRSLKTCPTWPSSLQRMRLFERCIARS